jgi:hypothetical protein
MALRGAAADEIDDAPERRRAVERGRGALDDLDLLEIHGRNLEQPERRHLRVVDGQAVGQYGGVPSVQALHAKRRGAERRGRRLQSNTARLVQQHRDVAGRHQELLLNLLAPDHFDPQRLIRRESPAACRGDDDGFLDFWKLLERHFDASRARSHGLAQRREPILRDDKHATRGRHHDGRVARLVGLAHGVATPNFGRLDRLAVVFDRDWPGDRLRKDGQNQCDRGKRRIHVIRGISEWLFIRRRTTATPCHASFEGLAQPRAPSGWSSR